MIGGVCAPASIECTNNLQVTGNSTLVGLLTCGDIEPFGSGGLKLLKLDGTTAFKVHATGASQFFFKRYCGRKFNRVRCI